MTGTQEAQALEPAELDRLLTEIRRYLEAVDLFRREGREPRWRLESPDAEVLR